MDTPSTPANVQTQAHSPSQSMTIEPESQRRNTPGASSSGAVNPPPAGPIAVASGESMYPRVSELQSVEITVEGQVVSDHPADVSPITAPDAPDDAIMGNHTPTNVSEDLPDFDETQSMAADEEMPAAAADVAIGDAPGAIVEPENIPDNPAPEVESYQAEASAEPPMPTAETDQQVPGIDIVLA